MTLAFFTEARDKDLVRSYSPENGEARYRRQGQRQLSGFSMVVEAGVTTREHRVPRGIAADEEGKALKTEILWAEVA